MVAESTNDNSPTIFRLRIVALLCGAAVMALEMVGVRLLEPFLGSTIYVWGAIIGIFLGALSIGYYGGGKIADRSPHLATLAWLIFFAAIWIFFIPFAAAPTGEIALKLFIDPRWQALSAALTLYAIPSILLGAVSPFLVRLAANEISQIGQIAGSIYALSTCGSIIGTFLVSFVLTEYVGSMRITWGIGALLLLLAFFARLSGRKFHAAKAEIIAGLLLLIIGAIATERANTKRAVASGFGSDSAARQWRERERGKNLATRESAYHLINVFDGKFDFSSRVFLTGDHSARYMVFNDQLESGCLLTAEEPQIPAQTACGYVKLLSLGVLITGKSPEKIGIIGCGGGIGALLFRDDYPQVKNIDVADIDPEVFNLAGEYFNYPYPNQAGNIIRSFVTDGRNFLRAAPAQSFDYLVLDAYTAGGRIPKHLISREFFQLANDKLTPDGVVVANIISDFNDTPKGRLYRAVLKTAQSVFKQVYVFPRDLTGASNVLLVCSNHDGDKISPRELVERFHEFSGSLIKQPVEYAVRNSPASPPQLAAAPLLTDDFCPTDSMFAK